MQPQQEIRFPSLVLLFHDHPKKRKLLGLKAFSTNEQVSSPLQDGSVLVAMMHHLLSSFVLF